jgi:hypothetical protein
MRWPSFVVASIEAPSAFTILDDDGYDDLRINVSGAPGGARAVLYRGGADGLATARCGLVP